MQGSGGAAAGLSRQAVDAVTRRWFGAADATDPAPGGAAPLAEGEKPRPIVAKDVVEMYTKHAAAAYEEA